jgi:hypothetical protein
MSVVEHIAFPLDVITAALVEVEKICDPLIAYTKARYASAET